MLTQKEVGQACTVIFWLSAIAGFFFGIWQQSFAAGIFSIVAMWLFALPLWVLACNVDQK